MGWRHLNHGSGWRRSLKKQILAQYVGIFYHSYVITHTSHMFGRFLWHYSIFTTWMLSFQKGSPSKRLYFFSFMLNIREAELNIPKCLTCQLNYIVEVKTDSYLGWVLDILPPCPHHHEEIGNKEGAHETHHHRVVGECSKKLCGTWNVHHVRHDEERAAKEG